ncbi:Rhodanese-like domain containing protein [Tritrichomonas foetus]|uniref:protein-tyrosine-phosphatase n=1 Tax=Tritrichomonas foetus TaxID=1144522 RepID=A0A1J4KAS2_9EUKA|nr:Rhodanese-like domain containing protein [Tritrichomonas foetus]|eukprot:OHT06804.1 Rhodanese-like domain containing protein [Tritrichomonas foetus]
MLARSNSAMIEDCSIPVPDITDEEINGSIISNFPGIPNDLSNNINCFTNTFSGCNTTRSNSVGFGEPVTSSACTLKSSQSFSCIPMPGTDPFKDITPNQLANFLMDPSSHPFDMILILDGRFEYEFRGGRICGARNVCSKAALIGIYEQYLNQNVCIIFHCEFSHNRGPTLMKMFRAYDREQNFKDYPKLSYPNIFLLQGGYRQFYSEYPNLCVGGYTPMREASFVDSGELKKCHSDYSRNMLMNTRIARPMTRRCSMSPRALEAFGLGPFTHSPSSPLVNQLGFSFSSSQPV